MLRPIEVETGLPDRTDAGRGRSDEHSHQAVEITITETPKANWGIRGFVADELALYKVETTIGRFRTAQSTSLSTPPRKWGLGCICLEPRFRGEGEVW